MVYSVKGNEKIILKGQDLDPQSEDKKCFLELGLKEETIIVEGF